MTVAFHTLGCKVNQYDSEAMQELLLSDGYEIVNFSEDADVYILNTCTVTSTGDKKSMQLARRIKREHPKSLLVLCGCLAQKKGNSLLQETGADLVLGTQERGRLPELISRLKADRTPFCAVSPLLPNMPFEPLNISRVSGHTRAYVKIQEGCNNHCSYCIIPSVRGPVRSRSLEDLKNEVIRLRDEGFAEIVLTGIHLASYGYEDSPRQKKLLDAIRVVHSVDGIQRIRLGSLEPLVATEEFCQALKELPKVCPQFHLALQSGSDTVLARMKRRYNTSQYLEAAHRLRTVFPHAAFTTDILTGFPGETDHEFEETCNMIKRMNYARIHVFPYSPREDTAAALMPGQLTTAEKERRCRKLIALGNATAREYLRTWLGHSAFFLPEEKNKGCWEGYTPEYIRVTLPPEAICQSGKMVLVCLNGLTDSGMAGSIIQE